MYSVLIVEDDPMVAMINEQYIKRDSRFSVDYKARNGEDALNILKEKAIDLVILDVYMPKADGLSVLRKIREMQLSTDVIMVTAANDRPTLEEALHLGIIDYLVKPFVQDRLKAGLEKFVSHRKALESTNELSQSLIDEIIDSDNNQSQENLPKGIQEQTLCTIKSYMQNAKEQWITADAISDSTSLSIVTVRRYLNYMAERGTVQAQMNYETGGRPSMQYKIN